MPEPHSHGPDGMPVYPDQADVAAGRSAIPDAAPIPELPAATIGDAGKVLAVNEAGDGYELADGSGGSSLPTPAPGDAGKAIIVTESEDGYELAPFSVIGVGDYVQYEASGTLNATTGSVDWSTPSASSPGTSIVLDDSVEWVGDWGYAVPVLSAGTYTIAARMRVSGATTDNTFALGILAADATDLVPWSTAALPNVSTRGEASACWTGVVPDGAHLDFSQPPAIGTDGVLNVLTVTVQRVA